MLDLVFLVCLVVTLLYALRGAYKETLCNVAAVVGILAAVVGFVMTFLKSSSGDVELASSQTVSAFLRIFELAFAFTLRFFARHFVKLYNDKLEAEERKVQETMSRYTRDAPHIQGPVYTESNFDDPELRFGKGGYTDNKF